MLPNKRFSAQEPMLASSWLRCQKYENSDLELTALGKYSNLQGPFQTCILKCRNQILIPFLLSKDFFVAVWKRLFNNKWFSLSLIVFLNGINLSSQFISI